MIAVIGGEEKTGKTTFALTWPKPIVYFEFDIGGWDRAKKDATNITRLQFPTPVQAIIHSSGLVAQPKMIVGMKELWYQFLTEYNKACLDKAVATIVLDTWCQVWEICRLAVLQEKQEAQLVNGKLAPGEKLRTSLLQIEYGEPNARMRNIMFYAKSTGKNLVLVTYDRDEYKAQIGEDGRYQEVRTGRKVFNVWSETMKHSDIALWTSIENSKPIATITLAGIAPLEMVGVTIPENKYETLMQMIQLSRDEK